MITGLIIKLMDVKCLIYRAEVLVGCLAIANHLADIYFVLRNTSLLIMPSLERETCVS
jgi:hypothetical protein